MTTCSVLFRKDQPNFPGERCKEAPSGGTSRHRLALFVTCHLQAILGRSQLNFQHEIENYTDHLGISFICFFDLFGSLGSILHHLQCVLSVPCPRSTCRNRFGSTGRVDCVRSAKRSGRRSGRSGRRARAGAQSLSHRVHAFDPQIGERSRGIKAVVKEASEKT